MWFWWILHTLFSRGVESWGFGHVNNILEGMGVKNPKSGPGCKIVFATQGWSTEMQWKGWKWICLSSNHKVHMLHLKTLPVHIFLTKVLLLYLSFWFMLLGEHGSCSQEKKMRAIWQTTVKQTNACNIDAKHILFKQKEQKNNRIPLWYLSKFS